MYGARARLGLVVPSTNTTAEPEIGAMLPAGVVAYAARVLQVETDDPAEKAATVLAMRSGLDRAVGELTGFGPAAIGFTCTAASFLNGAEDDRETCARLGLVTTSRAVVLALRALGVRRVALVTPYLGAINEREAAFLAEEGVATTSSYGLGIVGNLPKGRLPVDAAARAVLAADTEGADAVFVSCTNWRTLECLPDLERRLGRPVVSSNSATGWALLRAAGIDDPVPAIGRLGAVA